MFTHSPNIGKGSLGTGTYSLNDLINGVPSYFTADEVLDMAVKGINNRGGNITVDEYIRIVNDVVTNGTIYVDSNNVWAMYYNYKEKRLYRTM